MIKNKRVIIFGLGKEGISAANFLIKENSVTIVDQKSRNQIAQFLKKIRGNIHFFQADDLPKSLVFDLVLRSPGIRPDHPMITGFVEKGAKLTSVTKLFFDECPTKIIGITGTKGKGTTATLIYEMLKNDKKDVYLAGNIGTPALDILQNLKKDSWVVLELSSFQLMDLAKSPHIAVVLMITSEHLDWHASNNEYIESKSSIVKFQTKEDWAVINTDFPSSYNFAANTKAKVFFVSTQKTTNGVFIKDHSIVSKIKGKKEIWDVNSVLLPGRHNLQNIIAALAVAKILNVKNTNITKVLKSFRGLKHRLQLVREFEGIRFYNDSFSTTPETTIAAIQAFTAPKILILGGSSKKSDFSNLGKIIQADKSIKALVLVGIERQKILDAVLKEGPFEGKIIKGLRKMRSIVEKSYQLAKKGDTVILSPACASFDMFKDYIDRGDQYIKIVRSL